jgi:hypothetical protein
MDSYRYIRIDRQGEICCVRLRNTRLEENEIHQLGNELIALCEVDGCRKMALSLGPEPPDCLYSVFLAKLVSVRNALRRLGGQLVLCEASPVTYHVFEACLLHREFDFAPDFTAAIDRMSGPDRPSHS